MTAARCYDGQMVWLPAVRLMQPGDILLTNNVESEASKGLKVSALIRTATGGQFSHAMICSSPPTFIEAVAGGVQTVSLARCFAHDLANVRLLRYSDALIASQAAARAQREVGRSYSVPRAVGSVLPVGAGRSSDRGTFCSALVARCYALAGAECFKRVSSERTTPATIEAMMELEDITALVFTSQLAPNNIETMSSLDGDRVASASGPQTDISARYAQAVLPQADALVASFPEADLTVTPTLYGILQLIDDAFLAFPRIAEDTQDAYFDAFNALDGRLAALIGSGELMALIATVNSIEAEMIERNLRESLEAVPDIDAVAMRNLNEASQSDLARREAALDRYDARPGPSKAMRAYMAVDRAVAEGLRQRNAVMAEILARIAPSEISGARL